MGNAKSTGQTRADVLARNDALLDSGPNHRAFTAGTRPVMRWIKGDGLDDAVTRAAIGAATRLFGESVDYCLCTNGIHPERAREILSWAAQPVEWWPLAPADNPPLRDRLSAAGCPPEHFGYWWKWFPERVRPHGPEWILDGDMVVTGKPTWFDAWASGKDICRISQDDAMAHAGMYGRYEHLAHSESRMYSGLVSLPPDVNYLDAMTQILDHYPLQAGHDGRSDMCEQGVVAATFQRLRANPFPLCEFPFARAFEEHLDFGLQGNLGIAWGYHFGNSFRMVNPHFTRLVAEGTIYSRDEPTLIERFAWLGNSGQWGLPGWSLNDAATAFILKTVASYRGARALEIGTSRGRLSAMLASLGLHVTTIDHTDRGAKQNLEGMTIDVVLADARDYLLGSLTSFDVIVVDLHGNSVQTWADTAPLLFAALSNGGRLVINNARLSEMEEWREESGVPWLLAHLPANFIIESSFEGLPGVAVLRQVQNASLK